MKKIFVALMIGTMAFSLCACGGKNDSKVTNVSEISTASDEKAEENSDVSNGAAASDDTNASEEDNASANAEIALMDIYDEISKDVELVSPMEPSEDFILNYYGIDVNELDDYVFVVSEDATSAETIIIVKSSSKDIIASVNDNLEVLREDMLDELEDYLPEQYDIVEGSATVIKGDYIYLVISENEADIVNIISKYI